MDERENPFNITKSVDYTDEEIYQYWVEIAGRDGFFEILKPKSPMPMIILGGKGSGKTHLMRYYSYALQKMRSPGFVNNLSNEGYIGVYLKCTGLNPFRFYEKNQSTDVWDNVFSYYFELWLAKLLIEIIEDIFSNNNELLEVETSVCGDIFDLFDLEINDIKCNNFQQIISFIKKLQKETDIAINNCVLTKNLDGMRICVSPGKLIFGIPQLLSDKIKNFKKIKFVYLIDEFENLSERQQRYVNTLLREKELPATFKLGVRLYGIKTHKTFSGGEENKEGSEYERLVLDYNFRNNKYYPGFAKELCANRITKSGYLGKIFSSTDLVFEGIDDFFQKFDTEEFLKKIIAKYDNKKRPYISKLERKLSGFNPSEIKGIINNIECYDNPLIERTNILLFYRDWFNGKNLLEASEVIHDETLRFVNNKDTRHRKVLSKFKKDIIDQLHLECSMHPSYSGIDEFIRMSSGIPRVLLTILKHIFKWAIFNGEKPFKEGMISLRSQRNGVINASDWFFEDARMTGSVGKHIRDSIRRLAQFMREIRFSDLPPECSISAFSIDVSQLSTDTSDLIDLAERYSYLIKVGKRLDRNSKRIDPIYQLNGILAPKWDLPIYKRGEIRLSSEEADAMFNPAHTKKYNEYLKLRLQKYNVLKAGHSQSTLFGGDQDE